MNMNYPKNDLFYLNKTNRKLIKQSVNEFSVTQSEIMCRANCPRKWFYRYALGLRRKGVYNWHFLYGDLLHKMLALLYESGKQGSITKEFSIRTPEVEFPER